MTPLPRLFWLLLGLLVGGCLFPPGPARADLHLDVQGEKQPLHDRAVDVVITLSDEHARPVAEQAGEVRPAGRWRQGDDAVDVEVLAFRTDAEGKVTLEAIRVLDHGRFQVVLEDGREVSGEVRTVRSFWVLMPPLVAIALALWLRQVFLALAAGVFVGSWILFGDPVHAFLWGLRDIVVAAVTDSFQGSILVFTAALGGMVGVMARSGGTHGIVDAARHFIRGPRSAQFVTAAMGLVIFFDDYANTLLVGNTMRPVTDRMRVSREKLSYLVDCTAAPVATVALLSTWVGYQVGLIASGLESIGQADTSAYAEFVASVPYAGYSWFAMALIFWVVWTRRDFGPMHAAELRCRTTGAVLREGARPLVDDVGQDLSPPDDQPRRASLALIPILVVLVATAMGLYYDGRLSLLASGGEASMAGHGLRDIYSAADPASALLWAVMLGSVVSIALAVGSRTVDLQDSMEAWISGAKAMLPALVILVLAWSIGDTCDRLGTGPVVVDWATGNLSARLVPTVTFVVAAFLGFSTGTSWGTMAILMPIVIPLAHDLPEAAGMGDAVANHIVLCSIASVLSGSVFGDHCSPISDTTIMSSLASGADHVDHVRTQIPYALTAGACAVVLGTLPAGFGVPPWFTLPLGVVALGLFVRWRGRVVPETSG